MSTGGHSTAVGRFWDRKFRAKGGGRAHWWESPLIVRHINRRVCGRNVPGLSHGLIELVKDTFPSRLPLGRLISVGCGTGSKEIGLLQHGIAQEALLYEYSGVSVEQGRDLAAQAGLADRMDFRLGDALQEVPESPGFDVVYWNNALHHMLDVDRALAWSRALLNPGGLLLMDDYVGPSRFQWTDEMLEIATGVRRDLPGRCLAHPRIPLLKLPRKVKRPTVEEMIRLDPSEAADSGRILEVLPRHFPGAKVILTGGVVYHLALTNVLRNLEEEDARDRAILERLLEEDDRCTDRGLTHYAVAVASVT